jgi:glycosyltransferase 2 family protein
VSAHLKAGLRWLGALLSLAGIGYIFWRFAHTDGVTRLLQDGVPTNLLVHVVLAALLYSVGCTLLALAWWWLLCAFSPTAPPAAPVAATYATSQFAKYLPGNAAHYLARHAMLRRMQLPHGGLFAAAGLEAGCLIVAALIWAVPAAGAALGRTLHIPLVWLVGSVIFGGLIGLALLRFALRHKRVRQVLVLERPRFLWWALMAHIGFFGTMALSLAVVASAMPGIHAGTWHLTGVVTTSWLAGFLVPGSPAGIGVREAVFVELLKGAAPEATLLLLAAAFRVVTFLGDLGFFTAGMLVFAWLRRRSIGGLVPRD